MASQDLVLDPERVIRRALALGADEAEVYLVESRSLMARSARGRISRITYDAGVSLGIRVVLGRRKGNAGGDVSREKDVEKIIEDAIKIAKVADEDKDWPGFPSRLGASGQPLIYDKAVAEASPEGIVDLLSEVDSRIESVKGANPIMSGIGVSESVITIANSNGGSVTRRETRFSVYVEASGGDGGSYVDYVTSAKMDRELALSLADRVAKRAIEASGAKIVDTGSYDVILEPKVAASILTAVLMPAFSADNVQKGRSPLSGKLGETIADKRLSILDDPYVPWATGSTPFDDEGVPTTRKYLVESGTLKTFLYDTYTASKENRESTGNGFRARPWSDPQPDTTNVVIEMPTMEHDDAIRDIRRGLVVGATIGEWLSNPVSGMINATITFAYVIEGGEVKRVAKGMVLSGNIYEILQQKLVGGVGKPECVDSFCTPAIHFREASIAGK